MAFTYSFLDCNASISGPGGAFSIGAGSGNSEEGISISMSEEKSTMTLGADGKGMFSLHAANAGRVAVRLLKTSPVNSLLEELYNFQKAGGSTWGQNVITITLLSNGDTHTAQQCAFSKFPNINYGKEGGINEWEFMAVQVDHTLGVF